MGVTGIFGRSAATIDGTLTAGDRRHLQQPAWEASEIPSRRVGDLYPMITLKWNSGVNNYMTYVTGDIPVGAYDPSRIANIGIGHGAIDAGGGYTYLNPVTGHTFSGCCGIYLQFQESRYAGSKWRRFPFRLERGAISFEAGLRRPRWICLSTGLGRHWRKPSVLVASDPVFSEWVHRSAISSRSATCRDI